MDYLTSQNGAPIADDQNSLTAGAKGPVLLQDWHLLEKLAHFNRERIPERVVHAKGSGAYGTFEVTQDLSAYTIAKHFLSKSKCKVFVRFSTVGGESGSADSERDPRGFAVRFFTSMGNHDIVGNNTPVFFIRDGIKFPDFIHTQKRDPKTNLRDPQAMWDFWSLNPESMHQLTILMSDRGIPANYRQMHGYGGHTFSFWNKKKERFWVKFHFKSQQGILNLTDEQATKMRSIDPDSSQRDLIAEINAGNYPRWMLYVQIMPEADAINYRVNPFDITKVWLHSDYPMIEVGILELNKIPDNYFSSVEQVAFAPSNLVPGIGVSPDKLLQARLFAYADAQRYRLGVNYNKLKVNCPINNVLNYQRAGAMADDASGVNYNPNSIDDILEYSQIQEPLLGLNGMAGRYSRFAQEDYCQAGMLYRSLSDSEKQRLIKNICSTLNLVSSKTQEKMIEHFNQTDANYGAMIKDELQI